MATRTKTYVYSKGELRLEERLVTQPGPLDVQVRMRALSINYRDRLIRDGTYPGGDMTGNVALSDGAGEVVAVGERVRELRPGDRVVGSFFQDWSAGPMPPNAMESALGGPLDGVASELVTLPERGWVRIPDTLGFAEAATLPCAGVTAWNALLLGDGIQPGETLLTLGTGGVSIFALQLAQLFGARVIVTSSDDEKLARAEELGAFETINYRKHPSWSNEVLERTGGRGVDRVVEVGGAGTLEQSLASVRSGGTLALIGVLGGIGGRIDPVPVLMKAARLEGVLIGSRTMLADLVRAVDVHGLRPIVDRSFRFDRLPEALDAMAEGRHFGKIVVEVEG
ncbi:MAG: NAD(P)-dependent alcohol dehydrogenase [Planctomycetota bacterium]